MPLTAGEGAAVDQGSASIASVPALDLADRIWHRLCRERDAAREEVSACMRATESGLVESYRQLRQARQKARSVEEVMQRLLDLLDDGAMAR